MRFPGFARLLAILALVLTALVPAGASAQATSYTSQLTGQVIETTAPWSVDESGSEVSDGAEFVTLLGTYDGMIVAWLPPGTDLVAARDIFLTEFSSVFSSMQQIDRGAYGNVSYSLDVANFEGIEVGVFSLFLGQRESGYVEYYLYFSPVMMFADGMASAKSNVTVGGAPVFDGVDPTGLQEFLSQNAGISGGSTAQPDTNVIAEQPEESGGTEDPQPTAVSGNGDAEGAAYLASIQGEIDYLQTTLDDFWDNLSSIETNPDAIDEMDRIGAEWVAYPDRAAGIVAPDRLLPFDAGYRDLATNVETLGNNWFTMTDALLSGDNAAYEAAFQTFADQYDLVQGGVTQLEMGLEIQLSLEEAGGAGEGTEVASTAEAPAPTEVATGGESAEGEAYLAELQAELDYLQGTLDTFIVAFAGITGADPEGAATEINRVAAEWISYPDRAASIVAPAGYEDIDSSYRTLVGNIEALGVAWYGFVDALQAGTDTEQPLSVFLEIMGTVQEQVDVLNSSLAITGSGGDTTGETASPDPEVASTEVAQTGEDDDPASDGTRGDTTVREDIENETETGQTGPQVDPESFEELGLVEEGLYESPQHGVEVTWDESLLFAGDLTDPIISEAATGRDSIVLQIATGPLGLYYVDIVPAASDDPESFAEYWASDEYLGDIGGELLMFDTSRSGSAAVLTREYLEDGSPIISMREVSCGGEGCDVLVVARVFSMEADFGDVFSTVRRSVEADGERLISVFSNRDISTALEP